MISPGGEKLRERRGRLHAWRVGRWSVWLWTSNQPVATPKYFTNRFSWHRRMLWRTTCNRRLSITVPFLCICCRHHYDCEETPHRTHAHTNYFVFAKYVLISQLNLLLYTLETINYTVKLLQFLMTSVSAKFYRFPFSTMSPVRWFITPCNKLMFYILCWYPWQRWVLVRFVEIFVSNQTFTIGARISREEIICKVVWDG